MAIIWRNSALAHRHAEIGGELEDWNNGRDTIFLEYWDENSELVAW